MKNVFHDYWLFFIGILILLFVFIVTTKTFAANPDLQIEYIYPEEAIPNTAEFRLYVEFVSGTKTQLAVTDQVEQVVWITTVENIPMGRTLNYYMSAIDNDGEEGMSSAYPFKLIGKPTITIIRSKNK